MLSNIQIKNQLNSSIKVSFESIDFKQLEKHEVVVNIHIYARQIEWMSEQAKHEYINVDKIKSERCKWTNSWESNGFLPFEISFFLS